MRVSRKSPEPAAVGVSRYRRLDGFWRVLLLAIASLAVLLSVYQLFNLNNVFGLTLRDNQYIYILLAMLMPLAFLLWPAHRKSSRDSVPWYDMVLALSVFAVCVFFAVNGEIIIDEAWEVAAPDYGIYASYLLWALALEAARRTGGPAIFTIAAVISFYPLYAQDLPEVLAATSKDLPDTGMWHAMSEESILGIPMQAFAKLVIGFLVFGVALQHTGGGRFFLNLAFALFGHVRGGPAKVAIFASGLMGSMSGSVITNVLTTGVMTIPAMKRTGFSSSYAGGVEACASTGGVLMPPIMGATAFVMAVFLEVPYIDIAVAAIIPSLLYFAGLFIQIDAYAARNGLQGLPRSELPTLRQTMIEGWYFIAVFVVLIWMLVYLRRESWAPYFATVLLVAINQIFPHSRWKWADAMEFMASTGRLFAELAAILAGIGLIVGALIFTGKVGTIANDLLRLAGGNIIVLLLMGALTSFILGIGMTVTAAYIFLAIALAPALIKGGLDPMAVHLFILYWGMLSFITPPVALGAFAAATVAQAKPMVTGFQAMRLGSIIYFIPFFFVLDPALILKGSFTDIVIAFGKASIGVVLLAAGLQGFLLFFGKIAGNWSGLVQRAGLCIAGIAIAVPGGGLIPWSNLELAIATAVLAGPVMAITLVSRRRALRA